METRYAVDMLVFSRGALACALAVMTLLLSLATRARAEAPSARATPVHVIGIDSDDAEDQADALTGAVRSRVRLAPGWSLQETSHSLSMLTAALRCPARPDAACLQRIGDQIHTDRFVWGTMSKAAGNQVTADLHLWSRGKPDVSARETYSDNLKDQNDENLRKLATRLFERLTGTASTGTVTVHGVETGGIVLVDGQRRTTIEHGSVTIDLPAGPHAIEVRAPGFAPSRQQVTVSAGTDSPVTVKLVAERDAEPLPRDGARPHKGVSARTIVGWSAIAVGAGLIGVATIEGVRFLGLKDDLNADRSKIDKNVNDVCAPEQATNPIAVDACSKFHDAQGARTVGLVLGGLGAAAAVTGVILLVTDHTGDEPRPDVARREPPRPRLQVTPTVSPAYGGIDLRLTF